MDKNEVRVLIDVLVERIRKDYESFKEVIDRIIETPSLLMELFRETSNIFHSENTLKRYLLNLA